MPVPSLLKKIVRRTGLLFVIALVAWAIPLIVEFPLVFFFPPDHRHQFTDTPLHYLAVFALFFQALIWSRTLVSHWADHYIAQHNADRNDASTIRVVAVIIRVAIGAILLVVAIEAIGKSVTGLIAGLGIGGIAIAFALQNVLGDLFGAFSIALDKPFVVGDSIQVDSFSGTVERIGLKSTRVRADSGEEIVFSNGELLKGRIRNFGRMQQRRTVLLLKFQGATPPDKLERIPGLIREVVESQANVRFDRANIVGISDATIDVETIYFLTNPAYKIYADTRQDVLLALLKCFAAEGIELGVQLEAAQKQKIAGREYGQVMTE
jgi:small-conductance mechanosensitive channel